MNRYTIGAFKHSSTVIKGIQSSNFNANMEQIISGSSGAVDPTMISIGKLQPEFTFDSHAIKTILAAVGITGVAMASDKIYMQRMADDGLRAGAASHFQVTMANGLWIPTQIRAAWGQPAVISCRVIPRSSDGIISPLIIVINASLEEGQDVNIEQYTLGVASINGSALDGVDDMTIDFGINVDIHNVHVYPTALSVMSRQPVITLRTFDIDKFSTWTEKGVVQGASDSTFTLLDQVEGGARGSSPITFTIDAGMVHFEMFGGSQGQKTGGSVRFTPTSDGTAAIIAITGIT